MLFFRAFLTEYNAWAYAFRAHRTALAEDPEAGTAGPAVGTPTSGPAGLYAMEPVGLRLFCQAMPEDVEHG